MQVCKECGQLKTIVKSKQVISPARNSIPITVTLFPRHVDFIGIFAKFGLWSSKSEVVREALNDFFITYSVLLKMEDKT